MNGGVFWKGTDGNIWVKDRIGVNNIGKWSDAKAASIHGVKGYSQIADPNPPKAHTPDTNSNNTGTQWVGYSGGGGGGYNAQAEAEARAKADAIARYDEAIHTAQDGICRLGEQENVGIHNIRQDLNTLRSGLETNFNRSKGMYDMNTRDTIASNRTTRDQIAENARDQTRGLQRVFAAGEAGDGSFSNLWHRLRSVRQLPSSRVVCRMPMRRIGGTIQTSREHA